MIKSSGVTVISWLDLVTTADMVLLCPFGKPETCVNASDFPIVHGVIHRMGSAGSAALYFLIVDHVSGERLAPIFHVFPLAAWRTSIFKLGTCDSVHLAAIKVATIVIWSLLNRQKFFGRKRKGTKAARGRSRRWP
jgi:hypothetical protein